MKLHVENQDYNESSEERRDADFAAQVEDAESPLYRGCKKSTKLSEVVALYKLKTTNRWSGKSFNGLLELLHDVFPDNHVIIKSLHKVNKFLKLFDLNMEKDSCLCE